MRLITLLSACLWLGPATAQAEPLTIRDLAGLYRVPARVDFLYPKRPLRTEHILEIVPYEQGKFYINTQINGHHACTLSGIAEVEGSRLVYRSVPGEDDPWPACTFSIQLQASRIVFDDAEGACRKLYCGASAGLDGVSFDTKRRRPLGNPSRIRSSAGYEEAVEVHERLLQWRAAQPKQP
ncbi:hypothetical protein FHR70_004222 [Microvirga lupini]|uniref:Uncharacterized protein n=1 Tax=Microvirga lupini TaxID=420324 RepID=A0A7W4VPY5_9HYPH|nr:hypothetical protein [Microvirga lupini]MBB3021132.1 hypothetical protein [Microvirga lupini]